MIGGGDTGADCIGTAHRQGALSVTNLAIGKQPPSERPAEQPWPMMPNLFEMASAHEEGGERTFLASTVEFLGNAAGEVRALRVAETEYVDGRRVPKSGTEREIPADLVLIAMGFTGPERDLLEQQLGTQFTGRGNVERDATYATSTPGVFVAVMRARTVPDRVGHRRGPRGRRRGRHVPHGRDGAAGTGAPDRCRHRPAARLSWQGPIGHFPKILTELENG